MKLAIVTDAFPPDVNGVAMTLERLAAGMIGRGHTVQVIHPGVSGLRGSDGSGRFSEVCVPGFALPRYAFVKPGWPRPVFLHRHWKAERPHVLYIATEGLLGYSALWARPPLSPFPVPPMTPPAKSKFLSDRQIRQTEETLMSGDN